MHVTSRAPRTYNYDRYEQFEFLKELVEKSKLNKCYPDIYDRKDFKLRQLRGQESNIVDFVKPTHLVKTTYQE